MRIAVAGGTGTVGRRAVEAARERGHEVVVLTRSNGIDLVSGTGLDEALRGVEVVIDASNLVSTSAKKTTAFFTTVTRNLLAAEERAGVRHHVSLSIVGVDRAPYGYYAAKVAQERAVEAGAVPWTILRAMQFHEFAGQMLDVLTVAGLHLAPRGRSQPVAAREVGERLVELAEGAPAGHAPDFAGPREERLEDMVRKLAHARGLKGPVLAVSLPGKQYAAMRGGETLPGPDATLGRQTFDEWLAEQASAPHPTR
ncbi:SDR family oxidoreductase [Agromyces mariniharenae]|uniref:SDR family oxidoreductase n=1 Tax=Agromyces mariniharenae TaxID=2604423 RepID=A0A5S4V141_9MICO|nr:SDR family oxidoreductase [Agromyces mariniharenae]TYL52817.1 SDR family oxidoreductase [Agromyces mariniharenae]